MSNILALLTERGMVHDATPSLAERLAQGPINGYCGFDPTADSLHVGNLVPVMALAWLQRAGGIPIALVGGGTGLIGDPSGKRNERPMLSAETIEANATAIAGQLRHFLSFEGPTAARLLNNAAWLGSLGLLEFLRETGKHFTVNYMLQKDSVKSRMEAGISYTEFSYMLIQAHDFAHLYRTERCELQLGGSDQWGNITAGIELISRREAGAAHGLVLPLLTTAAGAKFGKSEEGNVWLDPARTTPYKFYQFWLNTDDRDVERLLHFFTFLERDEIARVMREQQADPGARPAQHRLADEVTARVHGDDAVARARRAAGILFGGAPLATADTDTLAMLIAEVPAIHVTTAEFDAGVPVLDAFVRSGLASSRKQARQFAGDGALLVNDAPTDGQGTLGPGHLLAGRAVLLRRGKRQWAALRIGD